MPQQFEKVRIDKWYRKMIEKIFDVIKNNIKNPRLYITILVLILVFLLLFPYIDANYFYYRCVNNRIDILTKMTEIDLDKVTKDPTLSQEYSNLLAEIEKQTDGSIGSIFVNEKDSHVRFIKFITGGSLVWLIAIAILFSKKNTFLNLFISFIVVGIVGGITGWIFMVLPTVVTPMVNYIGFPLLLAILIVLLATGSMKQKKTDNQK